jgi:hypothetical protein
VMASFAQNLAATLTSHAWSPESDQLAVCPNSTEVYEFGICRLPKSIIPFIICVFELFLASYWPDVRLPPFPYSCVRRFSYIPHRLCLQKVGSERPRYRSTSSLCRVSIGVLFLGSGACLVAHTIGPRMCGRSRTRLRSGPQK